MKKNNSISLFLVSFLAFTILTIVKVEAQPFLISFAGTGESTLIDSVKVENLTRGISLTLKGNDTLRLALPVGISPIGNESPSIMRIYPNPMMDNSLIEFRSPAEGDAAITVYEMTGKVLSQYQDYIENGRQQFRISGLQKGIYLVNISGNGYRFSGKILCNSQNAGNLKIEKVSYAGESAVEKISKKNLNEFPAKIDMGFASGERLKFTAISGIYSTVKTDKPTKNKTLSFNFVPCTDGDNNNYSVVVIGKQTWMAENLKTTKYDIGTSIPLVTDGPAWAALSTPGFCWYNNDETSNKSTYGALYNWYSVNNANICPPGWHVPADAEWTILTDYVGGIGVSGGKLKETGLVHWNDPNTGASNETGFTALPGGYRLIDGVFSDIRNTSYWWSSTKDDNYTDVAWARGISSDGIHVIKDSGVERYGFSVRCLQDVLPSLKTLDVTDITSNTATSGGDITSEGTYAVTARGVCWSTEHNPTTANSITTDGEDIGSFVSSITGLTVNSRYFVRAYATSQSGTAYGKEILFTIKGDTGSVTDIDGNTYATIEIGTQTWMAENLKTTKYNDDTEIPLVKDSAAWVALWKPGFCWHSNDSATNNALYGALYNFYAVNTGKLCPAGWKVPSDDEWKTLEMYLGMTQEQADTSGLRGPDQGKRLKNNTGWNNENGTNSSGFAALPAGSRYMTGDFHHKGEMTFWWSSTSIFGDGAVTRFLDGSMSIHRYSDFSWYHGKTNGFSVRCLKNE